MADEFIEIAYALKRIWRRNAILWKIADYALSLFAFIPSIVVVFMEQSGSVDSWRIIFASSVAATLTLVIFTLNPKMHIRCHRKAWIDLDLALHMYIRDKENPDTKQRIMSSIINGEQIINSIYDIDSAIDYTNKVFPDFDIVYKNSPNPAVVSQNAPIAKDDHQAMEEKASEETDHV